MKIFFQNKKPLVYLISTGQLNPENYHFKSRQLLRIIKSAVDCNIPLIQIREKKLGAKSVYELTLNALDIAKYTNSKILVNERLDIALAAKADGVHLTSKSMPIGKVRKIIPKGFIIGVSTHSLKEGIEAKAKGAHFITFSPIFSTPFKAKYGSPKGLNNLKKLCEALDPFPVIALGGINETNYRSALENGSSGFASIRLLNNPKNLSKIQFELNKQC